MDINYKILWFEDTDESYETLSRRTERYVVKKNLKCQIERVYGISDFDITKYDLNSYEVLVVDLQLSHGSKGYEIIEAIRAGNYVNDVLFYSAAGVDTLERVMKDYRLEGVFLSERDNRLFMEKMRQLIDKSVRRSENVINIRGIVMDETSEFDSQMSDIVLAANTMMSGEEISAIKTYISKKLLQHKVKQIAALAEKYPESGDWEISDLLAEHEFNSMMRAKLVNKIVNMRENARIAKAVSECADMLPEAFPAGGGKSVFADAYNKRVIKFRNKLAHVKRLNARNPVLIGEVNGVEYKCDAPFCSMIRETLIQYGNWFDSVNEKLAENE